MPRASRGITHPRQKDISTPFPRDLAAALSPAIVDEPPDSHHFAPLCSFAPGEVTKIHGGKPGRLRAPPPPLPRRAEGTCCCLQIFPLRERRARVCLRFRSNFLVACLYDLRVIDQLETVRNPAHSFRSVHDYDNDND